MKYLIIIMSFFIIELFNQPLDKPDECRFTKVVLDDDLNEPI
jgi:hypothetical protein